jgi:tRNA nucleotidyltransferase (CCA-adding enzyme)
VINFCELFNHPIYEVGGCVRDSLLKIEVKDVDLASSLRPLEFKKLCRKLKLKTFDTGIDHGTITVLIDKVPYEHTTFRKDVSCDGRNATVSFSDTIEEDLSRRDFTINAIAKLGKEIIDPFEGRKDLEKRILKTVGNAEERFSEDYLRIIRAARFKSRLNMNADAELIQASQKLSCEIITHVSIERITDEIKKSQKHAVSFLNAAEELGFLNKVFPILDNDDIDVKKWLTHIDRCKHLSELHYFAAVFIQLHGENAANRAAEFRLSNQITKGILHFQKHGDFFDTLPTASTLRILMLDVKDYYEDLKVYSAEVINDPKVALPGITAANHLEAAVKESIKQPYINGGFLKKSGAKPAPYFKTILDECGNAQAGGADKESVEKLARQLLKDQLA